MVEVGINKINNLHYLRYFSCHLHYFTFSCFNFTINCFTSRHLVVIVALSDQPQRGNIMEYVTSATANIDSEGLGRFVMPKHDSILAEAPGTQLSFGLPVLVNHADGVRFETHIWTTGENAEETSMMAVWEVEHHDADEESEMVDRWEHFDIYC